MAIGRGRSQLDDLVQVRGGAFGQVVDLAAGRGDHRVLARRPPERVRVLASACGSFTWVPSTPRSRCTDKPRHSGGPDAVDERPLVLRPHVKTLTANRPCPGAGMTFTARSCRAPQACAASHACSPARPALQCPPNDRLILEAAARVLAEDPKATMQRIADEAGVARLTVYSYRDREALRRAISRISSADPMSTWARRVRGHRRRAQQVIPDPMGDDLDPVGALRTLIITMAAVPQRSPLLPVGTDLRPVPPDMRPPDPTAGQSHAKGDPRARNRCPWPSPADCGSSKT